MSTAKELTQKNTQTEKPVLQRAVEQERQRAWDDGEHTRIGLDTTGAIHHLAEHERRIVVIKSGEIEHVERAADHGYESVDEFVTDWIGHVDDTREWERGTRTYRTQHEFENLPDGMKSLAELMEDRR
jgi:ABC-type sulfate/molybdate transport systems ATPase subunit